MPAESGERTKSGTRAPVHRLFWIAAACAVAAVACPLFAGLGRLQAAPKKTGATYLSPGEIAVSRDGRRLYMVCERSDELRVVDVQTGALLQTAATGHEPRGLAISPDGGRVYVANSWDDSVSEIETQRFTLLRTIKVGWEPTSVVLDKTATMLYVANRLSDDVSVIDLKKGVERERLTAGRGASYLARSPDGKRIYSTHVYPNLPAPTRQASDSPGIRQPPVSEITVIDTATRKVVERKVLTNAAGVFHVALSPTGRLGVAAIMRPKNLVPVAQVEHGGVFADSLALFGPEVGETVEAPLDELERYSAMPFAAVFSPDAATLYVSASGSDSILVVSVAKLLSFARTHRASIANDLSASAHYVVARIAVGKNPRGMALSPDGKRLYVANRLDDSLSVIDTTRNRVTATLHLGSSRPLTPRRQGEQLFYSSRYAFQGQFGCANCHIDATYDGLTWDLEPDGFGQNLVDNRSIESLHGTEPFKWNGSNADLFTECGPRTAMYFYRSQSYSEEELGKLVEFVYAIPLRPNRYRLPDGQLTAAQARGREIFERLRMKSGRPIPRHNQCAYCHHGPKFTNQKLAYVGTTKATDTAEMLDVPHLTNEAYSAPYLHDGSARTLADVLTAFNPLDAHGVTSDHTASEIKDLVEYLKSL